MPKRKSIVPRTVICQIKGTNGTGKTTIVKQLGALSDEWTYLQWPDGTIYATVFDNIRWVAIGKYDPDGKMGGCDLLPTVDAMKQAITDVVRDYHGWWIVFEGMMISTIKSTFYNFVTDLCKSNKGYDPIFLILKSTGEKCVERIEGRGTKKPGLKIDNVAGKNDLVIRHAKEYDPNHVRWLDVDTTPLSAMVDIFLWEVYDCELMDALYGNDFDGYDSQFPGCSDG